MRLSRVIACILAACAVPAAAETYSWVDNQGTYHFTDDIQQIPPKYRKKAKKREDVSSSPAETVAPRAEAGKAAEPKKESTGTGTSGAADSERFGGKTQEQWRSELSSQEAELTALEQQMHRIAERVKNSKGLMSKAEIEAAKREHDQAYEAYQQKYKTYSTFVESARKAGLAITIPPKAK